MSDVICTFLWLYPESVIFCINTYKTISRRFFSLLNALIDIHDYNEPLQMCTRWKKGEGKMEELKY